MNEQTEIQDYKAGFQRIEQSESERATTYKSFGNDSPTSSFSGDNWGISHLPSFLSHLENHFSFSAALCSILGYVIIASFGEMQTVGQYFGYIFFLSIIWFIYSFKDDGKNKYWKPLLFCLSFVIILFFSYTYWLSIKQIYHVMEAPFKIDTKVGNDQSSSTLKIESKIK